MKQIIKDGAIKATSPLTMRYKDSSVGYVYVTENLGDAMDFSTRPEPGLRDRRICVFKIKINANELKPDPDEEKHDSTLSGKNGWKNCYAIDRDLQIGTDVIAYLDMDFHRNNNALGKYMQDIVCGNTVVRDSKWKKL